MRFLINIGLGLGTGVCIWTVLSGLLFVPLSIGGGFPPGPQPNQFIEYLKVGMIVGAIHGGLVAIGVTWYQGSIWMNLFGGILLTEVVLALVLIGAFYFEPTGFKRTTMGDTIQAGILYYLIFSAVLVVPSVLIGFVLERAQRYLSAA